jgi:hypothetical protein
VNQPVGQQIRNLHKQPEIGDARNHPIEFIAQMTFHVLALQPGFDISRRFLGAFLVCRSNRFLVCRSNRAKTLHLLTRVVEAARRSATDNVSYRPMHEQIGVPPNRRRKVCVGIQRQAEMPHVLRRILGVRQ